jgi:hypothetical protein
MKLTILVGCLALGLVGCATHRGGTGDPYDTQYGAGWSSAPAEAAYVGPLDSIYPVRHQPSIQGNDSGGVRPLIDPYRQWEMNQNRRVVVAEASARAEAPREPVVVRETDSWTDDRRPFPRDPIFNNR